MVSVLPKSLGRTVWPLMVMALVSLAIYVSGGRLLLGALPRVQEDIEHLLSQRFSSDIRIGQISGAMEGFSPRVDLTDFVVLDSETGALSRSRGQHQVESLGKSEPRPPL